ncbi:threonine/serine exporter family protein [Nocardioides jensenii]|uniref:threonine/serine ThrE exporter family protein n=1 Tax=Nocardioides jensenii TaxID=1843 RepID=UPI00082FDF1D|nr:threonine/serine exporter family protein [Nocardioides jensenii]
MAESHEIALTVDLSLRIGEMLLSNGAGAADVTATMQSVAYHLGMRNPIVDVTFTSLSMSYQPEPGDVPLVMMRQVKQRDIDYEDLTRIDHLVRDLLADRIDLSEARATVAQISSSGHARHRWAVTAGIGVMSAGVGLMLGGNTLVVVIAFVAAMLIDRTQLILYRQRLPTFYLQVAGGAVATLLALAAAAAKLDVDPSVVVTANIIMLLSGIGFMGGLQDALSGFYVTSNARMTEALLSTAGIIAGVSGGLALGDVVGVDIGRLEPGRGGLTTVAMMSVGAAVAAAAFAFSAYSPKRILIPIGIIAAIAIAITYGIEGAGFGRTWSVAVAALFIGLVSYSVSGRVKVPPLVIVVSAIVPLLPGLSIYRGLSLMSEGGATSSGLVAIITAASVAIALASGVILGEYIAQPLKREARKLEGRLSGPRLVGPFRARSSRRKR